MKYTEYLRKNYRGRRLLRLGYSVESFLNNNVDPSIPNPISFIDLDTVLYQLIPEGSVADIVCQKKQTVNGVERYVVYNLNKKEKCLMEVTLYNNTSEFLFNSLKVSQFVSEGLMSLVHLSRMMQKSIVIRVFPGELRIMS